jgi:hypothetical protein
MKQHDIICVSETWVESSQQIDIMGYNCMNKPRLHKHKNAWRASGGICIYYKSELENGITEFMSHEDFILWLKLDKIYFGTTHDIYLAAIYFPPEKSTTVSADYFDVLLNDIGKIPLDATILICGDVNARTCAEADLIEDISGSNGALNELFYNNYDYKRGEGM